MGFLWQTSAPAIRRRAVWPRAVLGLALTLSIMNILMAPASAAPAGGGDVRLARVSGENYLYDIPVTADFAQMITCDPAKYGRYKALCKTSTATVDGSSYTIVETTVTWDKDLIDNGQISYHGEGTFDMSWWQSLDKSAPGWTDLTAALKKQALVSNTWKTVTLRVLASPPPAGGTLIVPIPVNDLARMRARARMVELAKETASGTYYPDVKVPKDLSGYQSQMLAYGNAGRRDPNFRKNNGSATVLDLSLGTVKTKEADEKVYRDNSSPPYFTDQRISPELSRAAQFQAEYNAHLQAPNDVRLHTGPDTFTYQGKTGKMTGVGDRTAFFGVSAGIGEGAGPTSPGDMPLGWMKSDTHFRPFFNVRGSFSEVGFGAAQSRDGTWYFIFDAAEDKVPPKALDAVKLPTTTNVGVASPVGDKAIVKTTVTALPPTATTGPTDFPDARKTQASAAPTSSPPSATAPSATASAGPPSAGPPSASADPATAVKLCKDNEFGQPCATITADTPNLTKTAVGNDSVSSVRVPKSTWLSLYFDFDYRGICRSYSSDTTLPAASKMSDQASSAKLSSSQPANCPADDVVTLCSEAKFGGQCITPTADVAKLDDTELGNDQLSSFALPAGSYLSVYQDHDFAGTCQSFSADRTSLSDTKIGDNAASSIKITRTAPTDCPK